MGILLACSALIVLRAEPSRWRLPVGAVLVVASWVAFAVECS